MEARPSRVELIKILVQDRDHHFSHPHDVTVKFLYSIGGTITTILIAFFIKDKITGLKEIIADYSWDFVFFGLLIIVGYAMISWGLGEHTAMHTDQRRRIESAIEYLIVVKPDAFDFDSFWSKYGQVRLKYNGKKKATIPTSLIVAEPDTRNWLNYHDRKIELGILIILIGVIGLLTTLFK
ncbi:MAG: hypothetical protein OCD76_18325 [Reichenbachiella sp.]